MYAVLYGQHTLCLANGFNNGVGGGGMSMRKRLHEQGL